MPARDHDGDGKPQARGGGMIVSAIRGMPVADTRASASTQRSLSRRGDMAAFGDARRDTSLTETLDRVAPFLPDTLMPRASLDHARRVAALFPADAVNFFGFECRLGEGRQDGTDCALSLSPDGARALAGGAIGPSGGAWRRIERFCRWWGETHGTPFADASAIWLEFDAGTSEPTPNLMFGYWPDHVETDRPWRQMQDTVFPALFDGDYSAALHDHLERCLGACPEGTGDFQIGVMLGRPVQAVRLCIFDLPREALDAYLDAIGWAGNRATLQRLITALRPHCDFVGLHFDIAARTLPRVGIEPNFRSGSWSRQPHREPRWQGIWTVLADEGLISQAKRDALLAWAGHQQILLHGEATLLLRGLSHVKVALADDGGVLAKAYFGIALRENSPRKHEGGATTTAMPPRVSLEEAIARAEAFLLDAQDANGAWRDFLLPAGLSDSWVTAYVAEALAGPGRAAKSSITAARRAWSFLQGTESDSGGWSYNPQVPGDADSTLWGLRLAHSLGEDGSAAARSASAFLDRHVQPDGGLATYADAGPIRAYTGLPASVPFDGWTQSHVCVSAAGASLPHHADRLAEYLLARQEEDGSWPAYFWFDREYATGEAVGALDRLSAADGPRRIEVRAAVERATAWLIDRVTILASAEGRDRPAFALACAARGLAQVARSDTARLAAIRAGQCLAAWQGPTGSWGPSARLRVPRPDAIVPLESAQWAQWAGQPSDARSYAEQIAATFTNFSPDHRGVFGTATVLRALRQIAEPGER